MMRATERDDRCRDVVQQSRAVRRGVAWLLIARLVTARPGDDTCHARRPAQPMGPPCNAYRHGMCCSVHHHPGGVLIQG